MGALDGKGALVTGGSRGIGRAIVKRLAADGAAVVFSYRQNEAAAADVVREVAADGDRAVAVRADQGSLDDLRRLAGQAEEHLDGAFLAGPDSGWITGQNLLATGGLLP